MLLIGYHSPPAYAEGDAEMSLVGALLAEGKTSRLYKRLVYDEQVAVSVSATQEPQQLQSIFRISVLCKPDADLGRIEQAVDEELARFTRDGPREAELEQRKAAYELAQLSELQHVENVADRLNEYEFYWGEPNSFRRDLDRYRRATVAGVREWAAKVLTPDARVLIRVLPEQAPRAATPRDEPPAASLSRPFEMPGPQSFTLSNGIAVQLWQRRELPVCALYLLLRGGGPLEDTDQAGLTELTARMLTEGGAGARDALQFSDALQALGAELDAGAQHEYVTVTLTSLKRNLDPSTRLFADALLRPRFAPEEWQRVQRRHLEALKEQEDEPRAVAQRVGARVLFGDQHPYGQPVAGTSALDPLLGDWSAANKVDPAGRQRLFPSVPDPNGPRLVLVDRPGAEQTVISFMTDGPRLADPRRVQFELLNTLWGGTFTSRLNRNLREQHGYTYGAHSRFDMQPSSGCLNALTGVQAEVTGAALRELLGEIQAVRGGDIRDEELTKARALLRTELIQSCAGLNGLLAQVGWRAAGGLGFESVQQDLAALDQVTTGQLNVLAGPAIPFERGVLVLVGDKPTILKQIADLDLPRPVEVDVRGDALSRE